MIYNPHPQPSLAIVRRKPGVPRPGFLGMRGQWLYDYGMQDYEHIPPGSRAYAPRGEAATAARFVHGMVAHASRKRTADAVELPFRSSTFIVRKGAAVAAESALVKSIQPGGLLS